MSSRASGSRRSSAASSVASSAASSAGRASAKSLASSDYSTGHYYTEGGRRCVVHLDDRPANAPQPDIDSTINEERNAALADVGWKRSNPTRKDFRHVHEIAPTGTLQSRYADRQKEQQRLLRRKQAKVLKGEAGEEKAKDDFLARVLAGVNAPKAVEALQFLQTEEKDLLTRMEETQVKLEQRRHIKTSELNKAGVFSKDVNAIRASSMYRVELKRRMTVEHLRRPKKEEEPVIPDSIEHKLQGLLDDLNGGKNKKGAKKGLGAGKLPAGFKPSKQVELNAKLEAAMIKAAVSTAAAKQGDYSSEEVERRRLQAQEQVAQMIDRYRVHVEQKRTDLLKNVGLDLAVHEIPKERIDESLFEVPDKDEEKEPAEEQTVNQEAWLQRKADPAATAALVETALSRVQKALERYKIAEEEAAPEARPEDREEGDSDEESSDDDHVHAAPASQATPAAAAGNRPQQQRGVSESPRVPVQALSAGQGFTAQAPEPPTQPDVDTLVKLQELAQQSDYKGQEPKLPALVLDETCSLAEKLQKRLERVWQVLRIPVMQKLDMVIKYTSKEMSHHLEAALQVWEMGAAAVMDREHNLVVLEQVNKYKQAGNFMPGLAQEEQTALDALQNATVYVLKAEALLAMQFDDQLTLEGVPYTQYSHEPDWWHGGMLDKANTDPVVSA